MRQLVLLIALGLALIVALIVMGERAQAAVSTSYCLSGRMADGTFVRPGSAAHNGLPLGTPITVTPAFFGRTKFVVRDRIGHGTQLDLWAPSCSVALAWGRRVVQVRVGWPRRRRARLVARLVVPPRAYGRWEGSWNR